MLTLTSQYALQALIHLARHSNSRPLSAGDIAKQTGIPPKYLSMILGSLVHEGVLESTRGKGGGFFLAKPPKRIRLWEIVFPFEPSFRAKRKCPFGNRECSDEDPCLAHFEWQKIVEQEKRFLQKKSLFDVAKKQAETAVPRSRRKKGGTRHELPVLP